MLAVSLGYLSYYWFIIVLVGVGNSFCFNNKEEVATRDSFLKPHSAGVSVVGPCTMFSALCGPAGHRLGRAVQGFQATFVLVADH